MGRLRDLRLTFPTNLADNADYPHVEYVIVDYNSNDGLGSWVRDNYIDMIHAGSLVYVRTDEPKFFQMTHSRNIGFKIASGDIIVNVDADNYAQNEPPAGERRIGFAEKINALAQGYTGRVIFAPCRTRLRGRIGLFKRDFIEELGGYDEDLKGYGADDRSLFERARAIGYLSIYFGTHYVVRIHTRKSEKMEHMEMLSHLKNEKLNNDILRAKMDRKEYKANVGRPWGAARIVRNFTHELQI